MATKIERAPSMSSTPAVKSAERSTPARATQAVAATPAQAPVSQAGFAEAEASKQSLINAPAQHVTQSADPGALWGAGGSAPASSPDLEAFRKLPTAEQKAKLQELRADRNQLTGAIEERVGQLEARWGRMQNKTRARALNEYNGKSKNLDPQTRQEVAVLVAAAQAAQAKIDALNAEVKGLPADSKVSMPQKRKELAAALRQQRKELATAVSAATAAVDDKGLKVDRLAETEATIDPSSANKPEDESLSGMVKKWFTLDWLIGKCSAIYDASLTQWQLQRHAEQARNDIREADLNQKQEQSRRLMEEVLTNYRNVAQGVPTAK